MCFFYICRFRNAFMSSTRVERAAAGSAQRRRQRLLCQWLRHERMTVAMAVAEAVHHSSRGQRTATAEATHDAPRSQFAVDVAGGTELFQLYEDELNGVRPPPLAEVRPQGRLEQNTGGGDCEHYVPMVQALDPQRRRRWVRSSMFWTSSCKRSSRNSPHVQVSSTVLRVSKPMDVEQVLDVPVLHMNPDELHALQGLSGSCTRPPRKFLKFLYRCWFLRTHLSRRWLLRRSK